MSENPDKQLLEKLCKKLNKITKKKKVSLKIVEIKGTIFFFPQIEE